MWPCSPYSGKTRDAAHRRMSATPTDDALQGKRGLLGLLLGSGPPSPSLTCRISSGNSRFPKVSAPQAFPPVLGDMTTEGFSLTTPRGEGRGGPPKWREGLDGVLHLGRGDLASTGL